MDQLREAVYRANIKLFESGLVLYTWGTVSGVDRDMGAVVIKPSGIPYKELTPELMITVSLEDGRIIDAPTGSGKFVPSLDMHTHLEIYRAFDCNGIAHTHSEYATIFAQARLPIRAMGTTHADYFQGDIPVTRPLKTAEVESDYETNTGRIITECFRERDPKIIPAVLVSYHGPFTWGRTPEEAVEHAIVLEFIARIDYRTMILNPNATRPAASMIEKHYRRKHESGDPQKGE
ncbi:MAG: L-ribulose-5-phosphate 4-epimerase AraD [Deltaproteobacteria bacterium]|nr:L-ribulose-5-phosphate 4-epimerase AraD [Candidatus Zymogenaceae bacterium]